MTNKNEHVQPTPENDDPKIRAHRLIGAEAIFSDGVTDAPGALTSAMVDAKGRVIVQFMSTGDNDRFSTALPADDPRLTIVPEVYGQEMLERRLGGDPPTLEEQAADINQDDTPSTVDPPIDVPPQNPPTTQS